MGKGIEHTDIKKQFIEELSKKFEVHSSYYKKKNEFGDICYSIRVSIDIDGFSISHHDKIYNPKSPKVQIEISVNQLTQELSETIIRRICN